MQCLVTNPIACLKLTRLDRRIRHVEWKRTHLCSVAATDAQYAPFEARYIPLRTCNIDSYLNKYGWTVTAAFQTRSSTLGGASRTHDRILTKRDLEKNAENANKGQRAGGKTLEPRDLQSKLHKANLSPWHAAHWRIRSCRFKCYA